MKKVVKIILGTHGIKKITMAISAQVITVGQDNGSVCMWLIVPVNDSEVVKIERHFEMVRDLESFLSEPINYCGTAYLDHGRVAVHVFEFLPL